MVFFFSFSSQQLSSNMHYIMRSMLPKETLCPPQKFTLLFKFSVELCLEHSLWFYHKKAGGKSNLSLLYHGYLGKLGVFMETICHNKKFVFVKQLVQSFIDVIPDEFVSERRILFLIWIKDISFYCWCNGEKFVGALSEHCFSLTSEALWCN